jgi:hypothetical protein
MPRRKSSEKANTTEKIFSDEQVKYLPISKLIEMQKQGWDYEKPAPEWGSYNYQAPGFDPAKDMISPPGDTYIAGTVPKLPTPAASPELEALRADPEMQQMAAGMGVTVDDLLLFREMMLDRFGSRYNPQKSDQSDDE